MLPFFYLFIFVLTNVAQCFTLRFSLISLIVLFSLLTSFVFEEMQGTAVFNGRQHVGLQKLSALAGVTHSFLGPVKKYKFIQDDSSEESTLVSSCYRVFENLELTCAAGQLVYETILAHHKVYRTGSGCLLFLAGAWSLAALDGLQKGISVAHIVSAMSEGLAICMDVCRKSSISTDGLGLKRSETRNPSCSLQRPTKPGLKGPRLSRHFCEAKSENTANHPEHLDMTHLTEGLSHGCSDAMNLVIEICRLQSGDNLQNAASFSLDKVLTCAVPGLPEDCARVVPGCIVLVCTERALLARRLEGQKLNIALIDGDLKDTYRHLGYNRPSSLIRVGEPTTLASSSGGEEWMEKVVTRLSELGVNAVLVSGLVSEKVMVRCCSHQILIVEKVQASILKAIGSASGAVPVTYATQLSRHCVGSGVDIAIWRELEIGQRRNLTTAVSLSVGKSKMVTAVLTSCVHAKLQALEDQFWSCAHRLHHALKDGAVLPGAGETETVCVYHLRKQAENYSIQSTEAAAPDPLRAVVLHLMADGLIDYVSTVMGNTGKFSKLGARTAVSQCLQGCNSSTVAFSVSQVFSQGEHQGCVTPTQTESRDTQSSHVYDCLTVKQEAWRRALDLVFLVLQADAEVITGVDRQREGEQDLMHL